MMMLQISFKLCFDFEKRNHNKRNTLDKWAIEYHCYFTDTA